MDLTYFKEQIQDELDGAMDYATKADDFKENHSEWYKKFSEMSRQELGHAENLIDMLSQCTSEMSELIDTSKSSYNDVLKEINK